MDTTEFRRCATDMVNYIANYYDTLRSRLPLPDVKQGYMKKLVPEQAPDNAESYEDVMKDLEDVIMKGVGDWRSPHFHGYVPLATSFPALIGDMLAGALGTNPFSWAACPAAVELEMAMMDWLGRMLNLPQEFLFSSGGKGGGVIQRSADESVLIPLIAARARAIREHKHLSPGQALDKLVAYTSEEAHSCMKKAALIALVKIRNLPTDENFSLRGATLAAAIKEDKRKGLIPFFLGATVGTTSTIAIDNVSELGPICEHENVWLHVDGAYAGSAVICPEFRHFFDGVEYATSICINPHKLLHVNLPCSAMWVRNRDWITEPMRVEPEYLKDPSQNVDTMPEYRHWHIHLSRPFNALKVWFVFRMYGVKGLQERIRKHAALAKEFETLVRGDCRFEIVAQVTLGIVCFKLKGANELNRNLSKRIGDDRRILMTPSVSKGVFYLRFTANAYNTERDDIVYAWKIVLEHADLLLHCCNGVKKLKTR